MVRRSAIIFSTREWSLKFIGTSVSLWESHCNFLRDTEVLITPFDNALSLNLDQSTAYF